MSERTKAFADILGYLDYRIAICRARAQQYATSHGPTSRAAATERSALFEAEFVREEIAQLGLIPRRSKRFAALAAERAAYLASSPEVTRQGERDHG